jgi:hypothetical protein
MAQKATFQADLATDAFFLHHPPERLGATNF